MKNNLPIPNLISGFMLILFVGCLSTFVSAAAEHDSGVNAASDWREDYAYSMGVSAIHYLYPYMRQAEVRWNWTMFDAPHPEVMATKAMNKFWHATRQIDHNWEEGGAPNNDTLYSLAWVHVDKEPMVVSIPKIDRYHVFQIAGANSDNFTNISELKHGRKAGQYALVPRGWKGELPEGVTYLAEVPSPWVAIVGRTYVKDSSELPYLNTLMKQYDIRPLSKLGVADFTPEPESVFNPHIMKKEPLGVWKVLNKMLTENPPIGFEKKMTALYSDINIGPGKDVDALPEDMKRGLERAAKDAMQQIVHFQAIGMGSQLHTVNGWKYSLAVGRAGFNGDFMTRTVHQSYSGILSNDPDEAVYYGGYMGSDDKRLNGDKTYKITFPKGKLPPVSGFWSIAAYDKGNNLVKNDIKRYSIGDRTEGLVYQEDGSLVVTLSSKKPANADENWLPTPAGEGYWLVFRAYQPAKAILTNDWKPPAIQVVE